MSCFEFFHFCPKYQRLFNVSDVMKILAGILFVLCGVALVATVEKNAHEKSLKEILFRSQQSINDDVNNDVITTEDYYTIADLWNNDDVSSLMNIDDVVKVMNKDALEKLRVGIHSKTYCHCHSNRCSCCRTVYLFWKIPIFKACIGIYYEGQDFVMKLKVYGITLVKHKLPLYHQKPVCARTMGVYELCAQLYDVKIHNGVVHACVKITEPVELDLKCFTLHRPSNMEETLELATESDPDVEKENLEF